MQFLTKKQQFMILISGICIELILGTVYAYSVIRLYLENELNLNHTQSSMPYLTSLAVFAVMVMLTGRLMHQKNFYKWALLGIFAVGLGYLVSAFSQHYLVFTLGFGVLIGSGVGILYSIPIQVIQSVYKKHQGLSIGLTIAGFGLSTVIVAPILNLSFQSMGFTTTLVYFGIVSSILLLFFFWQMIRKVDISLLYRIDKKENGAASKTIFVLFFIIFIFGIMFGLSMIGLTVYIGLDYYQLHMNQITILMSFFALSNGLARPLFGFLYDKLKLKSSVIIVALITLFISSIYVFFNITSHAMFILTTALSWATVGAWLALMPLITKDLFGKNNFSKTYGVMYLSYGVAAIIGNLYTSILIDDAISLSIVFIPMIFLMLTTILTIIVLPLKSIKKKV